jgi:hypothetical protein
MTPQNAYLLIVAVAFAVFAGSLLFVSAWSRRPRPARQPVRKR